MRTVGADIDAQGRHGKKPLVLAICYGHERIARVLLGAGASVSDTLLHSVIRSIVARAEPVRLAIKLLKEHFTSPAGGKKTQLETEAALSSLLSAGNGQGDTPLHTAVRTGNHKAALALLDSGSRVDAKNNAGLTPLCLAQSVGLDRTAELLIERGADVEYSRRLRGVEVGEDIVLDVVERDCTEVDWDQGEEITQET
ncbi:hypothetical protein MAPG_07778 [Magnaporthiopsis poae ATCC 64411]|uniref:Uncharacterized protein n=1 Tax=Magnaporthiopsis poae (strain ATCC 64411 / 73-15) TaxID=644358 RepID=A0A0C4E5K6_MAGP6|nr:hypothetical protein MAPG_07778 [Magnaporthiopsis poae ATCC 64411]